MKFSKLYIFIVIIFSFLFSIIGFFIFSRLYPLLFPLINPYLHVSGTSNFWINLIWFMLQILPFTILPLAFVFVTVKSNLNKLSKKVFTCGIILSFAILFLFIRVFILRFFFRDVKANFYDQEIFPNFMILHTHLYFELFEFIGIITGTFISILVYKKRA